ncbi:MAG: hypothetical protein DMG92_05300, partial [Acidobacteria bacterium]
MFNKCLARLGSIALILVLSACLLALLAVSGSTQNTSKDRILYAVDSARVAPVKGTAHPMARQQFNKGRISPQRQLTGVA